MDLETFCTDVVPDFTPLGGNRPDCAVVMAVVISLLDDQRQQSLPSLVLPPDVLDTAMATVCATIIIRSASDIIEPPANSRGRGGVLACRLEVVSDAVLEGFRVELYNPDSDKDDDGEKERDAMPWRNFDRVFLQIAPADLHAAKLDAVGNDFLSGCKKLTAVHLPDTLHTVGHNFLSQCKGLVSIDLRNTKLHTAGECFLLSCQSLTAVHLPDTLQTVGSSFLQSCTSLVSVDLRNTKLHTLGNHCILCCEKLTAVHLPDTLRTVGHTFALRCKSLVSIDLRNTKIETLGAAFMHGCEKLTSIQLPDTLHTVGAHFLGRCALTEEEVARLKCSITARCTEKALPDNLAKRKREQGRRQQWVWR